MGNEPPSRETEKINNNPKVNSFTVARGERDPDGLILCKAIKLHAGSWFPVTLAHRWVVHVKKELTMHKECDALLARVDSL